MPANLVQRGRSSAVSRPKSLLAEVRSRAACVNPALQPLARDGLPRYKASSAAEKFGGTRVVPRSVNECYSFVPDFTVQGRGFFILLCSKSEQPSPRKSSKRCIMEEKIAALRAELEADLAAVHNKDELSAFWQKYLSKNGSVTGLTKSLRDVPKEERPAAGKTINEFKVWVEGQYQAASAEIEKAELAARNKSEAVDITLPGTRHATGALHPITQIKNEIIDVFAGMGFEIYEGPEIEDDDHNFTRLNVPKNHPARDMQDTFYVADDIVLRTQTSGGQIRVMDKEKPPIKVLVPGRVFRSDSDATHSPMFHQMEGLVVDKGITLCDLQGMLDRFVQALFGPEVKTRLRPSYFPFTEPSVEVDVSCFECHGKGCPLCKHSGWIEVLGAGVVHRSVLQNCGIDPEVYSGFAFGIGIERIAMLKYGINNIGLMFENDLRFLEQFKG